MAEMTPTGLIGVRLIGRDYTHGVWVFGCREGVEFIAEQDRTPKKLL